MSVIDTGRAASGSYKVTLHAKVSGVSASMIDSPHPERIGEFFVKYPNSLDRHTGFFDFGLGYFHANDNYEDFVVELTKPTTTDMIYWFNLHADPDVMSGWTLYLDYIEVEPVTINPDIAHVYEAEDYYAKAAVVVDDIDNIGNPIQATRSYAGDVISGGGKDYDSVVSYDYTAQQLDGVTHRAYKVDYYVKFADVDPAGDPEDIVARIESRNHLDLTTPGLKEITRSDALAAGTNYNIWSVEFTSGLAGTYQHRVLNRDATIYLDKIIVTPIAAPTEFTYEAEDMPSYLGCKIVADPWANQGSGGYSRVCITGAGNTPNKAGFVLNGPNTYDQNSGHYFVAKYSLRSGATYSPDDVTKVAKLVAIWKKTDGTTERLGEKDITAGMLSVSEFRMFSVIFKASTSGTMYYQMYFYNNRNIYVDKVQLSDLGATVSSKVYQAEEYLTMAGMIDYSDVDATSTFGTSTTASLRGRTGVDDFRFLMGLSVPQETLEAGNYQLNLYAKKTGTVGNQGRRIIYIWVYDQSGSIITQAPVLENQLGTNYSTPVTVSFANSTDQRVYIRVRYYGTFFGCTSDVNIDRFILERV